MKDLIDKISSYKLFNYLLPGVLFAIISKYFTQYDFIQSDIVIGVFLYYFIGLVISRVGSIIIEPFLIFIKFIKFADYKDYISAIGKDPKIEIFNEDNNMFRTFISLFFLVGVSKLYDSLSGNFYFFKENTLLLLILSLFVLFIFSYKKQTQFIVKRVAYFKNTEKKGE